MVTVAFGRHELQAEVAANGEQRSKGLVFRKELGADAGMLFVFPALGEGGFWMKNTLIPLSIAYMRREGSNRLKVVSILDMTPCREDPCKVYAPGARYDAALEVNRGWFRGKGIKVGDTGTVPGGVPTEAPPRTVPPLSTPPPQAPAPSPTA